MGTVSCMVLSPFCSVLGHTLLCAVPPKHAACRGNPGEAMTSGCLQEDFNVLQDHVTRCDLTRPRCPAFCVLRPYLAAVSGLTEASRIGPYRFLSHS